eukprot:scaffold15379_cov133-Isochrysis_galbana.AAC.4
MARRLHAGEAAREPARLVRRARRKIVPLKVAVEHRAQRTMRGLASRCCLPPPPQHPCQLSRLPQDDEEPVVRRMRSQPRS